MKKIQLYLLLGVVVFATGCPNMEPSKNLKNKNAIASQINDYLADKQDAYNRATDPLVKQAERNDLIEGALAMMDSNYQDYINRIEARRSTSDFIADVIELGTGAATGIAKGERPNQILGIALTAFRGGRKSIELNFYKQQTTPILISKMDGNRAVVYAEILQKMSRPASEYSIKAAVRDLVAYYNAGTIIRAFTELAKDTAAQTQQSEKRVLQLKRINPSDFVDIPLVNITIARTVDEALRDLQTKVLRGTPAEKADATEKLRLIYLDLVNGANKADFKPLIDSIKSDNATLKAVMVKLEGTEAESKTVSGNDLADVIGSIGTRIDPQTQGNLLTKLQASFDKVLKK